MSKLCFGSAVALLVTTAGAQAASFATTAFQFNVVPSSGSYYVGTAHIADSGIGKFTVVWDEPGVTGGSLKARGLQISGGTLVQFKPTVQFNTLVSPNEPYLLGLFKTTTGTFQAIWSYFNGNQRTLYRQTFVNGVKTGGNTTLLGPINTLDVRLVGGRSDNVGAIIWPTPGNPYGRTGRFLTATGTLGVPFNFALSDGSPGDVAGVGTAFIGTHMKCCLENTPYYAIAGIRFYSNFTMANYQPTLLPLTYIPKVPYATISGRNDGKAVFFKAVRNSSGKYDIYGRVYTSAWGLPGPMVNIANNTANPTDSGIGIARLGGGDLLLSYVTHNVGGDAIVYQHLDSNLAPVGSSIQVGPVLSGLANVTTFTLANGQLAAVYAIGKQHYVRVINP